MTCKGASFSDEFLFEKSKNTKYEYMYFLFINHKIMPANQNSKNQLGSNEDSCSDAAGLSIGDAIAFVRNELPAVQMQMVQKMVSNSFIDYEILEGVKKFLADEDGEKKLYKELAELKRNFLTNLELVYADLDHSVIPSGVEVDNFETENVPVQNNDSDQMPDCKLEEDNTSMPASQKAKSKPA